MKLIRTVGSRLIYIHISPKYPLEVAMKIFPYTRLGTLIISAVFLSACGSDDEAAETPVEQPVIAASEPEVTPVEPAGSDAMKAVDAMAERMGVAQADNCNAKRAENLLANARNALADGNEELALSFVADARRAFDAQLRRCQQAKAAINEAAKLIEQTRTGDCSLSRANRMVKRARDALSSGQAGRALDIADDAQSTVERERDACIQAARAEDKPEAVSANLFNYTVRRGDNLWDIAGKSSIYGDPFMWPLIYKQNSGLIEDPDLIFPDQIFSVQPNPLERDVNDATNHARTRGEWSLDSLEASDTRYLRL